MRSPTVKFPFLARQFKAYAFVLPSRSPAFLAQSGHFSTVESDAAGSYTLRLKSHYALNAFDSAACIIEATDSEDLYLCRYAIESETDIKIKTYNAAELTSESWTPIELNDPYSFAVWVFEALESEYNPPAPP